MTLQSKHLVITRQFAVVIDSAADCDISCFAKQGSCHHGYRTSRWMFTLTASVSDNSDITLITDSRQASPRGCRVCRWQGVVMWVEGWNAWRQLQTSVTGCFKGIPGILRHLPELLPLKQGSVEFSYLEMWRRANP